MKHLHNTLHALGQTIGPNFDAEKKNPRNSWPQKPLILTYSVTLTVRKDSSSWAHAASPSVSHRTIRSRKVPIVSRSEASLEKLLPTIKRYVLDLFKDDTKTLTIRSYVVCIFHCDSSLAFSFDVLSEMNAEEKEAPLSATEKKLTKVEELTILEKEVNSNRKPRLPPIFFDVIAYCKKNKGEAKLPLPSDKELFATASQSEKASCAVRIKHVLKNYASGYAFHGCGNGLYAFFKES